jgi:hypothetical protein
MVGMQNLPAAPGDLDGLGVQPLWTDRGTTRYDLHIRFQPAESGIWGWIEYNTALFEPGTIRDWITELTDCVASLAGATDPPLGGSPAEPVPAG